TSRLPLRSTLFPYTTLFRSFDSVWECTIFTVIVYFQIPNYCCQQDNRTFHEKIPLLLYPRPIEVQHYGIGGFVGIANVCHKVGVERIATVALVWVVKVYHVEFRLNFILIPVLQ